MYHALKRVMARQGKGCETGREKDRKTEREKVRWIDRESEIKRDTESREIEKSEGEVQKRRDIDMERE